MGTEGQVKESVNHSVYTQVFRPDVLGEDPPRVQRWSLTFVLDFWNVFFLFAELVLEPAYALFRLERSGAGAGAKGITYQ